jgi:hypothetical protein
MDECFGDLAPTEGLTSESNEVVTRSSELQTTRSSTTIASAVVHNLVPHPE